MRSPVRLARTAGVLYLAMVVLGAGAHLVVGGDVYVPGDAATTMSNLVADDGLFRAALVADIVMATVFALLGVLLHRLLRDVDRAAAAAMLVFVAVGAGMMLTNLGFHHQGDLAVVAGLPYVLQLAFGLRRPRGRIRGRDVAGVIRAVGDEVTRFRPGDEVFAETATGTFAEYTTVPEHLLARKPPELTFEQAAATPVAGATALQALRDAAGVRAGDKVLIDGAAGGVGTFAIQLARSMGAEVTGVCSARNLELARSLGADRVIDRAAEDPDSRGQRYDVVLDVAGRRPLRFLRRAVTPGDTLVLVSGTGGRVLGPLGRYARAMLLNVAVRQRLRVHAAKPCREDLDALARLVVEGAIRPEIETVSPLTEIGEVIRRLQIDHARAKNVLVP